MSSAVDSLVGLIPIAMVGGLLMKFTEQLGPQRPQRARVATKSRRPKSRRDTSKRIPLFGNFRNIGF